MAGRAVLRERLASLRRDGATGLIPFLTAGDPSMAFTERAIRALDRPGVVAIELGVPFSDPLADGPTIQRSSERALAAGVTLPATLDLVRRLSGTISTPIVLMSYYNPMLRHGLDRFAKRARRSGVAAVIATDLPVEEGAPYRKAMDRVGVGTVFLAAPTSSRERVSRIAEASDPFLYYVSMTGTTGSGSDLPKDVVDRLEMIRRLIATPLAVGFGVTRPEHVKRLAPHCDAVVVGSALVAAVEREKRTVDRLGALDRLVGRLCGPLAGRGA